jgi:aminopeptidase N
MPPPPHARLAPAPQPRASPAAPRSLPPPRADGRLPALATPVHYDLDLDVDPRKNDFDGRAVISVVIERPTAMLVLHAERLFFRSVEVRFGAERLLGEAVRREESGTGAGEVLLFFPRELPPGPAELEIHYGARFATGSNGLFSRQVADNYYAFSELEPCFARWMFPGFDEPAFKVPFDVAVTVPEGMIALSNMPERSRTAVPGGVRFRFDTTPPLPTYLVAIAVGDFTVVAGPPGPVPIRLVVTRGKTADPRVVTLADELTRALATYLASPYPMAKLDLVAIPDLNFAMENPGLVSFGEAMLLPTDPAPARGWERQRVEFLAHELAHQWFGDLVTLRWWDDAWLNEGLATYAAGRAIDEWRPSFRDPYDDRYAVENLLDQARASSLPIRREITTVEGAESAILTAPVGWKAAQVMSMIDRFTGPGVVRDALRRYLRDHPWGSAQTSDLLASFAGALPSDALLTSFLDQPGAPLLEWSERCVDGQLAAIDVRQEPLRVAAAGSPAAATSWVIPFCWSVDGTGPVRCHVLGSGVTTVPVVGPRCPVFIDPDPGGRGYYRFRVTPEDLRLAAAALPRLTTSAKIGLLAGAWETVQRRQLSPDELLRFLPELDTDTDSAIVREVTTVLGRVDEFFVDDRTSDVFDAYARARLRRHKARLGLLAGAASRLFAEQDRDRALSADRWFVASRLALAGDVEVVAAATETVREWIAGAGLDAAAVEMALEVAGPRLDENVFSRLLPMLERPAHPDDRRLAVVALGQVTQPAQVERVLEASLSASLSGQERSALLASLAGRRRSHAAVFDWVARRWDIIAERLPDHDRWPVWQLAGFACSAGEREALERVFWPGGAKPVDWPDYLASWYDRSLETGERCRSLAEYGATSVARFLATFVGRGLGSRSAAPSVAAPQR